MNRTILSLACVLLCSLPLVADTLNPAHPLADDPAASADDAVYMARAYELAQEAVNNGNHPFGALIVKDGEVLLEYRNRVMTDHDVTEHAETGLVSLASKVLSQEELEGHTLYTSTEPCIMCCGAIYWLGTERLVYGTSGKSFAMMIRGNYNGIPSREVFARMSPETPVVGPIDEAYGLEQHAHFWPDFLAEQAAKGNPDTRRSPKSE